MNRLHPIAPALVFWLFAVPSSQGQEPTAPPATEPPAVALQSITGLELGGHLRFLASDLMRGREAGSPEARLTAEYLAAQLSAISAVPLGDPVRGGSRSYLQKYMLESVTPIAEGSSLTLTLRLGESVRTIPCTLGTDYAYGPAGLVGGEIESRVVFVGYGTDEESWPDVRNKFALAFRGRAEGAEGPGGGAGDQAKAATAKRKGALGILLIAPPGRPSVRPTVPTRPDELGFGRSRVTLGSAPAQNPTITLSDSIRDVLVAAFGLDAEGDPSGTQSGELRARFAHVVQREPREDYNVVGYLPGVDPEKKKEVIVFSAHYDHEGVDDKGVIFNGSDDNASGTSGVLEIAQAFGAAPRPARSVAFLWVSGEEKGLLGSKWFADHHVLPEGMKIVADINLDMISRNDPNKIGATPSPEHHDYNSLVAAAADATRAEGLEMLFDSDPYYGRTDSFNFAAKGVPVIFFFAGLHDDYHKPTDDVEKADVEKAARVSRAAFRLGWKAAQADEAPKKIDPPSKP